MSSPKAYSAEQRLGALVNAIGPVPANVAVTPITATGPTEVHKLTIPASTLAAGVKWVIDYSGYFATGAVAPTSVTWSVNWGPVGSAISGSQIGSLLIPAAGLLANAANLGCWVQATVWGKSATGTAVSLKVGWHTATGVSGSSLWVANSNNTGLTAGVARDLDLAFAWSGGSGMTLTTDGAHIARAA